VETAAVREVFDRAAATYDAAAFPFFGPFGEALVEFAAIAPDERVLDVGCGAGAVLGPASRVAGSAVGIELSPAMAERARAAAPSAEVVVGDASVLPFEDGSFDVVMSSFVVFFMPDPTAALQEWKRVLKPGGRMVVATWAGGDPRWSWERDVRMPYVRLIDPERARELLESLQALSRFDSAEKVDTELRLAGLDPQQVVPHTIEFVFASEDDWWAQIWSHGARAFVEALPESDRERYRAESYEAMQGNREGDGFPRTYTALFSRCNP
jgi:SAM-dependent methyltransferase